MGFVWRSTAVFCALSIGWLAGGGSVTTLFPPASTPIPEITVIGEWVVKYDWDCEDNYNSFVLKLFDDGTFIYSNDNTKKGTWILDDEKITWLYEDATSYSGKVIGDKYEWNDGW